MTTKRLSIALCAAALAAAAFAAAPADAQPRTRHAHGVFTGARGGTATGDATVQRGRGFRDRSATWTGPNGGQRSVNDERAWNRADGTYSRDHDVTYRDGSTRSVDVDAQRTGPGQYSATREVTGRNGETRTQTGDFAVTRTPDGRSVSGDIQTTNAGEIGYQRDVAHQNGTRSVNSSASFADGTSITRASSGSCAGGTCSSSGAVTNRAGQTTTWDQSRTRSGDDVNASRDVTFADGATRSVDRARDGNGDGTGTVSRTVTHRNGETTSQSGSYEITH